MLNSPTLIGEVQHAPVCQTLPIEAVRARRTDPITSHQAAERAGRFAPSHSIRILDALRQLVTGTAHDIAWQAGLTVVQVDRRLVELQRTGLARVKLNQDGKPVIRDGFRVWELGAA